MNWKQLLCEKRKRSTSQNVKDIRNQFQKDYHRIIGSASFRRLQDKTQVFPLDKSDFIRTRLTHSLETASFAKSLGQTVFQQIIDDKIDLDVDLTVKENACSILECAGLIHDIGNPPFGHFGESSIRNWFRDNMNKIMFNGKSADTILKEQMKQDFYNFEGNAQAFRLLSKLHYIVDENGLNLTYALLNTIIKYPVPSTEIGLDSNDVRFKKMGYFYSEGEFFDEISSYTGAYNYRYPLTFLLEAADDIAYRTADIEDAVCKGFISYKELLNEMENQEYTDTIISDDERLEYFEIVNILKSYQDDVFFNDKTAVSKWIIEIQKRMIFSLSDSFIRNYQSIMNGTFKNTLFDNTTVNTLAVVLGNIARRYVFNSLHIGKMEISENKVINCLLDKFINAVINYDTDNEMKDIDKRLMFIVSNNYKHVYKYYSNEKTESEKLYLRLMLITDFICGMTDSYAKSLYLELIGYL